MKQVLNKLCILLVVVLSINRIAYAEVATTSYYCNFEDTTENANWYVQPTTTKPTVQTQWEIGRKACALGGQRGLYTAVLQDNGTTVVGSQQKSGGFCISAYRVFYLETGVYTLSFDWCAGNEELAVSVAPTDTMTDNQMRVNNGNFPQLVTQNKLKDGMKNSVVWKHETITFNVATAGNYSLIYTWRSEGYLDMGAMVDNVEIVKYQSDPTACDYAIQNFAYELLAGRISLTWQGNANRYEVNYFGTDGILHSLPDTLTTTSCIIPLDNLTDGVYTFQVRGICDDGTASPWAYVKDVLVYDPANHCIDFLNFHSSNVLCEYGTTGSSTSDIATRSTGVINHGYASNLSRHTVHYVTGETDARTNGQLRTVPEGAFASVRLGNWETGSEWERITYTITLDSTMGVLQFRYAMVDENPNHGQDEQPRFDLKILNANGQLLAGQCGTADFRPPSDGGSGDGGWHTIGSGYTMVQWRDWTTVGLNVRDYVGQTIKVQITNFDCSQSGHYGYCYFTLDCSDGKLQGVTCGEKPREMTADDGFRYRWYKPYAPNEPFYEGQDPTAQSLYVSPNDSNTYYVNLISKTNNQCYFTLQASALGRFPKARVKNVIHTPEDCINQLTVTNASSIFGYFTDKETGEEVEVDLSQQLANQYFTIRTASGTTPEYSVDSLGVEKIQVSNDGDSVFIHMYIAMDEGCYDEADTVFYVPAISETHGTDSILLCQGDEVHYMYDGQDFTFTRDGDYELSRIKNWAGCDSTFTVHVSYQYSYIFQRWDDVLSVWGNDQDGNRYDFTSFQWLRNGQPIEGATKSYYWSPEPLSENDNYQVVLQFGDGTEETSCEFTPEAYRPAASLAPTQVQAGQALTLISAEEGEVEIVSTTGLVIRRSNVAEGVNSLVAPNLAGYYFVKLNTPEYNKVFKISVR